MMNTKDGGQNALINNCALKIGLILGGLLLMGCGTGLQTPLVLEEVPIAVSPPNSEEIDIDIIIREVEQKTKEFLPDAYYGGLVYSGKCQELPKRRGRMVVTFIDVSYPYLLTERDLLVTASITTRQKMMAYTILDYSDIGLNTQGDPRVTDEEFRKIVNIAHQKIDKMGLMDCDVTITQIEDSWIVRCGRLEDMIQKCRFVIDATTGEIKDELKR